MLGFITGFFGKKTVQQSSYGKILVSKVSIFFAISIISVLSEPISGLNTGKDTTLFVTLILSIV